MIAKLNGRTVVDLVVEGVDSSDYPKFVDAYFSEGVYEDTGKALNDDELDRLTEENYDIVNQMAFESLL